MNSEAAAFEAGRAAGREEAVDRLAARLAEAGLRPDAVDLLIAIADSLEQQTALLARLVGSAREATP